MFSWFKLKISAISPPPYSPSLIKEGEVRWRTGGGLKVNILSKLLMKLKYFNIISSLLVFTNKDIPH